MNKIFLISLLVCASANAEWIPFFSKNNIEYWYENRLTTVIEKEGKPFIVKVWERIRFPQIEDRPRSMLAYRRIDCYGYTISTMEESYYTDADWKNKNKDWGFTASLGENKIKPNSKNHKLADIICKL